MLNLPSLSNRPIRDGMNQLNISNNIQIGLTSGAKTGQLIPYHITIGAIVG